MRIRRTVSGVRRMGRRKFTSLLMKWRVSIFRGDTSVMMGNWKESVESLDVFFAEGGWEESKCGGVIGGVLGLLAWYIGSGNGPGNPYGLAAVSAVVIVIFMWARIFLSAAFLQATVMGAATFLLEMLIVSTIREWPPCFFSIDILLLRPRICSNAASRHIPGYADHRVDYTVF